MRINNKKIIILFFLLISNLATGFCFGIYYHQVRTKPIETVKYIEVEKIIIEPIIRTIEQPVPVLVEVPVEVPVEVEVEKVVEKTIEVPLKLSDFASTEELKNWLNSRPTPVIALFDSTYDCENVARKMIDEAMQDGHYMWMQIVEGPYYSPISHKLLCTSGQAHALCSVIIDNDYYFIEPALKEYWRAYKVD